MIDNLQKPTAILFDWDNTLVNTFPVIYKGLCETFEAMGMEPWSLEDVQGNREGIHHSLRESFPRIFGEERWEKAREQYYKSFLANHLEMLDVLPGAEDTLKLLLQKDIFVAIVSNKTGKYLRVEVDFLGWQNYFEKVIGSTDAQNDKPHSDPVHLALEGSGIAINENVLFIGDSSTDVECALNAGTTPVIFGNHIFDHGSQNKEVDFKSLPHVENHDQLSKLIARF